VKTTRVIKMFGIQNGFYEEEKFSLQISSQLWLLEVYTCSFLLSMICLEVRYTLSDGEVIINLRCKLLFLDDLSTSEIICPLLPHGGDSPKGYSD